jgi:formylglycine-generating enzyme required for sulfatase activity
MGSPLTEQGRLPDEGPRMTAVFSRGFWVGEYEVSQDEYMIVAHRHPDKDGEVKRNPSEFVDANRPVERVTWRDAMEFGEMVTKSERAANRIPDGYAYRLPTEAEWEYMARAGSDDPFHFGPQADVSRGNFKGVYPRDFQEEDAGDKEKGDEEQDREIYGTAEVGSYPPNAWKIYDVHGNVGEWCYDRFNSRYPGSIVTDWSGPKGQPNRRRSDSEPDRLYRGGGWGSFAHRCRASARERLQPGTITNFLGFRLVLGLEVGEQ